MIAGRGGDSGSVTVPACLALLGVLTVTALITQVSASVVARHRVQAAADASALAAAAALSEGISAGCARADDLAVRMETAVADCAVRGWDVTVTVEGRISLGLFGARRVRATARAGPSDTGE